MEDGMAEVKDATPREMLAEANFERIELSKLIESRRNPRKVFDEKAQADLVESIKRYGVLTPLIVRAVGNDGKFEILAGARRYRASIAAGEKDAPCRVVEVENDTALEVIVVENLQRQNVHPLEEAESFREILELSNGDMAGLCNKVGKKRSFVEKRLILIKLADKGKKLFASGKMTEAHAMLIARLTPVDQKQAFEYFEQDEPSIGALRQWIEGELMLEIAKAPWDKADAHLVMKAGPCTTCPKRTAVSKELFDDIKAGDRCTDGECFKTKMRAHITNVEKSLKAQGNKVYGIYESYRQKAETGTLLQGHWLEIKKKDFCDRAAKGIYLEHGNAGRFIDICVVPDQCNIHGRKSMHGSTGTQQEAERKKAIANRKEAEIRLRVFKEIQAKQGVLDVEMKRVVAEHAYDRLWFAAKVRLCKAMGLEPKVSKMGGKDYDVPFKALLDKAKTQYDLDKLLVGITLGGELDPNCHSDFMSGFEETLKVDRKSIEKEVDVMFEKKKKLPKEKAKAKAKHKVDAVDQRNKKAVAKKGAKPPSEPAKKYEPDPLENSDSGGEGLDE